MSDTPRPMTEEDVERARRGEIAVDFARLLATIDALRALVGPLHEDIARLAMERDALRARAERAEADAERLAGVMGLLVRSGALVPHGKLGEMLSKALAAHDEERRGRG